MKIDIYGKKRYKVNLHMHTTLSDGVATPEEAAQRYLSEGYDAVCFADHWVSGKEQTVNGLTVLSGGEFNTYHGDSRKGVYHIIGVGIKHDLVLEKWNAPVQEVIDAIKEAGGYVILGHPAWSLNTPEMIKKLKNIDATEIYNAVSECGFSRRADSSLIVDMLGMDGYFYPLLATDDCHYYSEGDCCNAYVMVECDSLDRAQMIDAIKQGRFYASQGPEIHLSQKGDAFRVDCSEVTEIVFMSNACYSKRVFTGEALTCAEYTPRYPHEKYIRAYVVDKYGRRAWTNPIQIYNDVER